MEVERTPSTPTTSSARWRVSVVVSVRCGVGPTAATFRRPPSSATTASRCRVVLTTTTCVQSQTVRVISARVRNDAGTLDFYEQLQLVGKEIME